jgi:hypothetical protein
MALLLGELATKPLDENGLRNHMDVKKHHHGDQTKYHVDHLDLQDSFPASTHCRETKSDNCEDEEENNKNAVTPDPPIALFNFLKFTRQLFISGLYRSYDGMNGGIIHWVEVRGKTPPIQLS